MINLISIKIMIVYHNILSKAFKFVQTSYLIFFEMDLNIVLKTKIFNICSCILMQFIYCILNNYIIINYLKIKL